MGIPLRKALISAFGDVSNVAVVDGWISPPARKEVQVEVLYAIFSGADVSMRLGWYPLQRAAPLTPGYCLVGRVVSNGPGSSGFSEGSLVAALTTYDAQATLANVPERYLVPVPPELDTDAGRQQVAALTLNWTTAYGMVTRTAAVASGQRVFVHGLSGAVGHAAATLCLRAGAEVYGTASARNHAALQTLGVKQVFDHADKAWIGAMRALGGAHAAFDALGFESWDESYSILADGGILVGYGGNKGILEAGTEARHRSPFPHIAKLLAHNLKVWSGRRTAFYYIDRDDKAFTLDLIQLITMVKNGEVDVSIKKVWDLDTESLRSAHESWGKSPGLGSSLIRVARAPATG